MARARMRENEGRELLSYFANSGIIRIEKMATEELVYFSHRIILDLLSENRQFFLDPILFERRSKPFWEKG
jgi:hypothetical protein